MGEISVPAPTRENISSLLANDEKVKVAGIDCDGILRGKIMHKSKFLSSIEHGFGISSVVFGWDMHDEVYKTDTEVADTNQAFPDLVAVPDLDSFRRLPWEDNMPFFLVRFSNHGSPVAPDGRSLIKSFRDKIDKAGYISLAGGMILWTSKVLVVMN